MQLTITGLPKSGKTTIFNCATKGHAETSAFASGQEKANLGVAKVPDSRQDALAAMFNPRRVVPAEVQYVDLPGRLAESGQEHGIGGEYLNYLQRADALVEVVRAFEDPSLPHPEGSVDPARDVEALDLELAFADLVILERRVQRLEAQLKGAKASERAQLAHEHELLDALKRDLEQGMPIREQTLDEEAARVLEGYQFLTAKPLLIVLNLGESQAREGEISTGTKGLASRFSGPSRAFTALSGRLEMEVASLEEGEEREFRESLGMGESGLERMIRRSYALLGLISFLTAGPQEVRAWSIPQGTPAAKAAGKIHSDMERGFIRAEVVHFDELMRAGSMAKAKQQGLVRLEGKTYEVKDGDVVTFLFNV